MTMINNFVGLNIPGSKGAIDNTIRDLGLIISDQLSTISRLEQDLNLKEQENRALRNKVKRLEQNGKD